MSYTSSSFYLDDDNAAYINEQIKDKKRYNKSNWLNDLVDHLRDKAQLNTELVVVKPKVKRFVPPTQTEVFLYMCERGVTSDDQAQKFCDFYESKGWVVGKAKMKSWKAAARNWLKGYKEKSGGKNILQASSDSDWHLKEDTGF